MALKKPAIHLYYIYSDYLQYKQYNGESVQCHQYSIPIQKRRRAISCHGDQNEAQSAYWQWTNGKPMECTANARGLVQEEGGGYVCVSVLLRVCVCVFVVCLCMLVV